MKRGELQTCCTVDCCHERAFDISAHMVNQWIEGERIDRLSSMQSEIDNHLNYLKTNQVIEVYLDVKNLESTWNAGALCSFLSELRKEL